MPRHKATSLAIVARKLDLASHVQTQSGFDVAANDNILSDVVESLLAAIYLDAGLPAARKFVMRYWPLSGSSFKVTSKGPKNTASRMVLKARLGAAMLPACRKVRP